MAGMSQSWTLYASLRGSPSMSSRTFGCLRRAKRTRIEKRPNDISARSSSHRSLSTSSPIRSPRQALGKIEPVRIRVELPEGFTQRSVWKPILVRRRAAEDIPRHLTHRHALAVRNRTIALCLRDRSHIDKQGDGRMAAKARLRVMVAKEDG